MRIVSRFKDYYDYVEYLHSPEGGEHELTYDRKANVAESEVELSKVLGNQLFYSGLSGPIASLLERYQGKSLQYSNFRYCAVAGKVYVLDSDGKMVTENHPVFDVIDRDVKSQKFYSTRGLDRVRRLYLPGDAGFSRWIAKISKYMQAPVFCIHYSGGKNYVSRETPILSRHGFPSIVPPEQMYQEISMYLANVVRDNPDKTPPAKVSDKDKILQRGFDLKTSFRGKTS